MVSLYEGHNMTNQLKVNRTVIQKFTCNNIWQTCTSFFIWTTGYSCKETIINIPFTTVSVILLNHDSFIHLYIFPSIQRFIHSVTDPLNKKRINTPHNL